jgi:DNA polymerase
MGELATAISSYESWPEETVPEDCAGCQRCGLYKQGTRMVWGEGNPEAPILLVLDNPGAREDREGTPFVCGTRQTLQDAAVEVGFSTRDLYATYVLKYRPIRAYDKEAARAVCMEHLDRQLAEKKPKLVLCLGNVAVQSFFGNPAAEVKLLRGQWHEVRGVKTTAAYHPLAVRRRPNLWRQFLEDWRLLAEAWKESGGGTD